MEHPLARTRSMGKKKDEPKGEDQIKELMVRAGRIDSHPAEQRTLDKAKVNDWHVAWPPPPPGMPVARVKPAISVGVEDKERPKTPPGSRPYVPTESSAGTFRTFEGVSVFQVLRASSFRSARSVNMASFKDAEEDEEEMPSWMKRGSSRSLTSTGSRTSRNSGSFNSLSPTGGQLDDNRVDPFFQRQSSTRSVGSAAPSQPGSTGSTGGVGFFGGPPMSSEDEVSPSNRSSAKSPKGFSGSTKSILKRFMPTGSSGTGAAEDEIPDDSEDAPPMIGTKQLIGHLNKEQHELLRRNLKPATFSSGEHILRKDEPGSSMFFVISGVVKVEVEEAPMLGNGFFFGEMAVVKQWLNQLNQSEVPVRRSADVVAVADTRLMELEGDVAYRVFKDDATSWSLLLSISAVRDGSQQVLIPVI